MAIRPPDNDYRDRPHEPLCESLRPFPGTTRAPCNCDALPGTPIARLTYLLAELEKRFPGVVDSYSSEPPEPLLLAALDKALCRVPGCSRRSGDR